MFTTLLNLMGMMFLLIMTGFLLRKFGFITDAGKKPSHFLRELLLHGKVVAARTQEDRQQIRMLEGGCNNLNQLTKMAHQQGFSLLKGKIMDLLDEFNKIIGKI